MHMHKDMRIARVWVPPVLLQCGAGWRQTTRVCSREVRIGALFPVCVCVCVCVCVFRRVGWGY